MRHFALAFATAGFPTAWGPIADSSIANPDVGFKGSSGRWVVAHAARAGPCFPVMPFPCTIMTGRPAFGGLYG